MRQYGYFDFFDSSIFDLEAMIEEKVTGVSDEMVISILNEKFADFAIYPHRYNERFHMNRVFVPAFAIKQILLRNLFRINCQNTMMVLLCLYLMIRQMRKSTDR